MKLLLFLLVSTVCLLSCGKKDVSPADKNDVLTGTTWQAYGFKSPVSNKDVYYYLSFSSNGKGQEFVKYNKTEPSDTPPTDFTYTVSGSKLSITYPTKTSVFDYTGDKIKIDTPLINFVYTKI